MANPTRENSRWGFEERKLDGSRLLMIKLAAKFAFNGGFKGFPFFSLLWQNLGHDGVKKTEGKSRNGRKI
jgi:hypothetical protein